jgi:hypothetical protein
MKIETFPKSGKALSKVFTSYLSLSTVVIFLNGCRTLRILNDFNVREVIFVIISMRLKEI